MFVCVCIIVYINKCVFSKDIGYIYSVYEHAFDPKLKIL